jgi:hypothetical protein
MIGLNEFKFQDTEIEDNEEPINHNWSNDFNWTAADEDLEVTNNEDNDRFSLKRPLPSLQSDTSTDLGSGYDIKSIKLKVIEPIDDLFNDMEPVIEKTKKNEQSINNSKFSVIETLKAEKMATSWDADDVEIEIN